MTYFSSLKTSERLSLSFAFFGCVSLFIFLILINITYFFIWYADQKEKSFSDMNVSYIGFLKSDGSAAEVYDFREYLLDQDTIIIPDMGDLVCSPGVAAKIKEDPEQIRDKLFYSDEDTLYFIYSRYFEGIGTVKLFYDTTSYIDSQLTIMKTGLIFMILSFVLQFFAGRYISGRLLRDLKDISRSVKDVDINTKHARIRSSHLPKDDEIRILAEALNSSYDDIEKQTGKLKQFLTDVSHEFKTPLMVMNSRLDVLEKKKDSKKGLDDTDIEKLFASSRQNISKLNGLLESLFFVSRIEEQSSCLIRSPLQVYSLMEARLLHIAQRFPYKTLSYNLEVDTGLEYSVEENTFCILVDNLISNAMKFSPDNMEITVSADKKSFSITDNGPGIPKRDRNKIWEKFYRTDKNKEGFGVGLYLVKRIADIYSWKISITQKKGKGATFKVDIRGEDTM